MSTGKDRLLVQLDALTKKRNRGQAMVDQATEEARPLVIEALIAGVRVVDLIRRPYSRAEIQKIKRDLRDAGRLPGEE